MIHSAFIIRLVLFAVFITYELAAMAIAQTPLPPPEDIEDQKKVHVTVSAEAQELAEEYAEILREFEDITIDYNKALMELHSKSVAPQRKQLTELAAKLAEGAYVDNVDLLISDLKKTIRELKERERELKTKERKAYRVTKSLRRDMEAIDIVLQYEVSEHLEQEELLSHEVAIFLKGMNHELSGQMLKLMVSGDSVAKIEFDSKDTEITKIVLYTDETDSMERKLSESLIIHHPHSPVTQTGNQRLYTNGSGGIGAIKELIDSIKVTSSNTPIFINSPTGQVKVTGWDKGIVLVQSKVEMLSNSRQQMKNLVEDIILNVSSGDSGILVEVKVPNITDPGTTIDKSILEIMIPMDNRLTCNSAFGEISVSDVQASVNINANNSSIDVNNVLGAVNAVNSNGDITLSDIAGDIVIQSSFAPVTVSDCNGSIRIKNAYAAVAVSQCEGDVGIHNSGETRLIDHKGSVSIANSDGLIEIRNLVGDVTAHNSYNPILFDGVEGAVKAENRHSDITALNIDGSLNIDNSYAPITARFLSGKLDIKNHNGPIKVLVTKDIDGPSLIHSSNDIIVLTIEDDVGLDLKASTINGEIKSAWPASITTTENTRELELSLGDGGPLLTLTGYSANIILNREH
ncbi:MAG: hypothetical protein U9N55_02960 [candidate division Zixibacteria bacterium]|nr:hypothetical protein [candidate division Zixibacteria bacterium]